jgi:hypothetical protein
MSHLPKKTRQRGVILTSQGLHKLNRAKTESETKENQGISYTLEALSVRTNLDPHTILKVFNRSARVDKRTLNRCFQGFNLKLEENDYQQSIPQLARREHIQNRVDWGVAPDVSLFFGRTSELATLRQWLNQDSCRLVTLLGMGGIGKTTLAIKLAQQVQLEFDWIIWRSLQNPLPLDSLLQDLVQFLSCQQNSQGDIQQLLHYLRTSRCLIILDNLETILQPGSLGEYRTDYEGYGELFRVIGQTTHTSCLILTSREKPPKIAAMEGVNLPVRTHRLSGLKSEAQELLTAKGLLGTDTDKQQLIQRYDGNPLALNIVATSIQDLFESKIGEFLKHNTLIFNGIRQLLNQQFERLSLLEKTIMYWLAINREWTSINQLATNIFPPVSKVALLEALETLIGRSLIEKQVGTYIQPSMVTEYITECLILECKLQQPQITPTVSEISDDIGYNLIPLGVNLSIVKSSAVNCPLDQYHNNKGFQ